MENNLNILRLPDESNKVYNYRCKYIKNNIESLEIKELEKYSKILANIKFKNCKYSPKIYNLLKNFI